MALTKATVNKSLAVLHPQAMMNRLHKRLADEGADLVDILFTIATSGQKESLGAIKTLIQISGAQAYVNGMASAAGKQAAQAIIGPAAGGDDDGGEAIPEDRRRRLQDLADGGDADGALEPAPPAPSPEPAEDDEVGADGEGAGARAEPAVRVHKRGVEGSKRRARKLRKNSRG